MDADLRIRFGISSASSRSCMVCETSFAGSEVAVSRPRPDHSSPQGVTLQVHIAIQAHKDGVYVFSGFKVDKS